MTGNKNVKINTASRFSKPVHAVLNGESVRITHVGDAEGMSPVYLCVDSQGQSSWQPQDQVRIADPDFLPISEDSLRGLAQSNTEGSSYPRTAGSRS